jgi:hypothetical protein
MAGVGSATVAGLAVDLDEGGGDQNGVLEPGEEGAIEPSWTSSAGVTCVSGTLANFTGPAGATYTIVDPTAFYGDIAAGATVDCHHGGADCYHVNIPPPTTRPMMHWDAMLTETLSTGDSHGFTIHVGHTFSDVSTSSEFYPAIEAMVHHSVVEPCGSGIYCPADPLLRQVAAILLARGLAGSDAAIPASGNVSGQGAYSCTSGGSSLFEDVSPMDSFCRHVHYLLGKGALVPCQTSPQHFCPTDSMIRNEYAVWVAQAMLGPGVAIPNSYTDPATGNAYRCQLANPLLHFSDITATDPYCSATHYLWARAVIQGCVHTPPSFQYCPTMPVERDQAAAFIAHAFGLSLYAP